MWLAAEPEATPVEAQAALEATQAAEPVADTAPKPEQAALEAAQAADPVATPTDLMTDEPSATVAQAAQALAVAESAPVSAQMEKTSLNYEYGPGAKPVGDYQPDPSSIEDLRPNGHSPDARPGDYVPGDRDDRTAVRQDDGVVWDRISKAWGG